jgi:hypothetical protein
LNDPPGNGGDDRIRTDNILLAGQALCWVELRPHGAIDGCCPRYLLLDRQVPLLVWLRPRMKVAASTGVAPVSSGLKDPDPELLEDEAE